MAARTILIFAAVQIVIGYWEEAAERLQGDSTDDGIRYAESVASLIELVGRKADQHRTREESIRPLATAAGA
jgi:hypothetical protein